MAILRRSNLFHKITFLKFANNLLAQIKFNLTPRIGAKLIAHSAQLWAYLHSMLYSQLI
jgi:hypothetical protein